VDFQPTSSSRLCSKHFASHDFIETRQDSNSSRKRAKGALELRYLKPHAVPSIFPDYPSYMSRETVLQRSTAASSSSRYEAMTSRLEEQNEEFLTTDNINDLNDINHKYSTCDTTPKGFFVQSHVTFICFLLLELEGSVPMIRASVKITSDMVVSACVYGAPVPTNLLKPFLAMGKVTHLSQLINLLCFIKSYESEDMNRWKWIDLACSCLQRYVAENDGVTDVLIRSVSFIVEQLSLLKCNVYSRRYSSSLLTFSYVIFASSASCYNTLREQNILCLPHKRTLIRISQKLDTSSDTNNKSYFRMRLSKLISFAKNVILLVDEMYVAGRVEFNGGAFPGYCQGGSAKTILCFMISSVCGSYRDVVSIIPTIKLTTDTLHCHFTEVLRFVEDVGFSVVAVCLDNHPVNRSFYIKNLCNGELKVSIPHPCRPSSPLFLLFDMTHNIKNVFNNHERRKIFVCPSPPVSLTTSLLLPKNYTDTISSFTADFNHVQQLYLLEADKPVKAAHKLNKNCFNPKSIEKTSVKFSIAWFHESTYNALLYYATSLDRMPWGISSIFHQLFSKLWKITNVKTPKKGQHKRDPFQDPITSVDDWKLTYLEEFSAYLETWRRSNLAGLSRETFLALRQTISAFVPLSRYLISEQSFSYVLLGFLQSDRLEGRFGWFRQLDGGNYFISLRQVRESERKIRIISLLKYSGFTVSDASDFITNHKETNVDAATIDNIISQLPFCDPPNADDSNVIYYIAGYIAKSVSATMKCSFCSSALKYSDKSILPVVPEFFEHTVFFHQLNRGGLCDPSDLVYKICLRCWSTFKSIKASPQISHTILTSPNARFLFVSIMQRILLGEEFQTDCENGDDVCAAIVQKFFNCMAKNWVAEINEKEKIAQKERKIKKLSSL
jgi:hypothetical protein